MAAALSGGACRPTSQPGKFPTDAEFIEAIRRSDSLALVTLDELWAALSDARSQVETIATCPKAGDA